MKTIFSLAVFGLAALAGLASFVSDNRLKISSSAIKEGEMIPIKYSCEGAEVSPPLMITNVPSQAKTLAIIVHDPDAPMAGGFTHWVVWNIATDGSIPENFKKASQGTNSANETGYKGMCPPTGTHHYHFKVYALDMNLSLDKSTDKAALENAVKGHILAEGELIGLYKKQK